MENNMFSVKHEHEVNLTNGGVTSNVYVKVFKTMFTSGLVAKLGPTNFTTLMALASYMNEKGECYPTQIQLAELIGVHKNTVNKYINDLLDVQFDGQALVTRKKVNLGRGNVSSYYTIHPISQVAIFEGKVKELSINPKKGDEVITNVSDEVITAVSDESIPTWCDVTRTNKLEPITIKNTEDEPQKLNSSTAIKLFQAMYRDKYNVNYTVSNYGREGKLIKDKIITPYPELAEQIITIGVKKYDELFKTAKYPRPTIAMFSWAVNQIIAVIEDENKLTEWIEQVDEDEIDREMMERLAKM